MKNKLLKKDTLILASIFYLLAIVYTNYSNTKNQLNFLIAAMFAYAWALYFKNRTQKNQWEGILLPSLLGFILCIGGTAFAKGLLAGNPLFSLVLIFVFIEALSDFVEFLKVTSKYPIKSN